MELKNRVSSNFTISEIECRCGCGLARVNKDFFENMLEPFRAAVRDRLNEHSVMSTNSCVRCQQHNKNEGGTDRIEGKWHKVSIHVPEYQDAVTGEYVIRDTNAWDGRATRVSIEDLHRLALEEHRRDGILCGGLGLYDWGIHIDNANFRLWDFRRNSLRSGVV